MDRTDGHDIITPSLFGQGKLYFCDPFFFDVLGVSVEPASVL